MQKIRPLVFFAFLLIPLAFLLRKTSFIHELDISLAYFFNDIIRLHPSLQNPCALLNSKLGNWMYDILMALFIIPYICLGKKEKWLERTITTALVVGLSFFCYFLFNRYITRQLHFKSQSPTGILPDLFNLAEAINWIKVKIHSSNSYPSDHGSTIFMFILSTYYLMGRKVGALAIIASIPFALPRLLVGAHWTSDLILGSLPLALFNVAWFFYTPLYKTLLHKILRSIYVANHIRKNFHKIMQSD